jgi:hypothetical protein
MATSLRRSAFAAIALVVAFCGHSAHGARLDFYLTIDELANTWELAASTDAPGGIGGIVVQLINYGTGVSVAPRTEFLGAPVKGFIIGNHELPDTRYGETHARGQAFAAMFPLELSSLVYGVGYVPVPDSAFGAVSPATMVGSAETIPTVFYKGSYNPAEGVPDFNPVQPFRVAMLYLSAPPPGGYDRPVEPTDISYNSEFVSFNRLIVPEPGAVVSLLVGLALLSAGKRCLTSRNRKTA